MFALVEVLNSVNK